MIDCAGTNYFVTVVMFMNDLLEIGIDSQTKVIYMHTNNMYNLCKFVDNVYERFTRNRYRLTNQSNICIQITYIIYTNLWIRIN